MTANSLSLSLSLSPPLCPLQSMYPSPQWWTYHPSRNPTSRHHPSIVPVPASASHPLSPDPADLAGSVQESSTFQTKASKVSENARVCL